MIKDMGLDNFSKMQKETLANGHRLHSAIENFFLHGSLVSLEKEHQVVKTMENTSLNHLHYIWTIQPYSYCSPCIQSNHPKISHGHDTYQGCDLFHAPQCKQYEHHLLIVGILYILSIPLVWIDRVCKLIQDALHQICMEILLQYDELEEHRDRH